MRVCYFGTYRAEYARNQILIEGLRRNGIEVIECHQVLWKGVEDRVRIASGGWKNPAFWMRLLRAYSALIRNYLAMGQHDLIIVGYPGQYDIFIARILAWWKGKPLVWDILNSMYLITLERGIHQKSKVTGWMIRILEKLACRLPDLMLLDTQRFVEWFSNLHGASPKKFRIVTIGADERFFQPTPCPDPPDGLFRVIYYGSYIPNHGVETIIRSASLLNDQPAIRYEMIGTGPELPGAARLAADLGLKNVEFVEWLDRGQLARRIGCADVVLGVFGTTIQNTLTNNNKIYEGFAMRKPVISASTPALPACLLPGEHLILCERGDPEGLANAILALRASPEKIQQLADAGQAIFFQYFDLAHIGLQLKGHLEELLNNR